MLPLCLVYIEEYVINSVSGLSDMDSYPRFYVTRTCQSSQAGYCPHACISHPDERAVVVALQDAARLLPLLESHLWVPISSVSNAPSDQTFVFVSRSSLSLGLPPLPRRLLPLPTLTQFFVLVLLYSQARSFIFSTPEYTPPAPEPPSGVDRAITAVFFLTCLEGLCGGSAYVNTFYHVGHEGEHEEERPGDEVKRKMEKEFRIGATGASDSCGGCSTNCGKLTQQASCSRRSSPCRSRWRSAMPK